MIDMSFEERRPLLGEGSIQGSKSADPHPFHHSRSQVISQTAFRTTPARWYILFAFCYMGFVQGFIGNAWGPIARTMESHFGWDSSISSLLATWMSLFFVPGALLFPVLMSWFNMRIVILLNTSLMAFAGALKILSMTVFPISYLKAISHITQIINGFCGAVPFSGVMYITVNWFPTSERLIATGIIMASLNTGIGVPFVLGPSLVPENATNSSLTSTSFPGDDNHEFFVHRLRYYLIIQGVAMIVTLLLVLVYFPSRPKFAPTASAVTARLDMVEGLKTLTRKGNFWLIVMVYGLTSGVFNGYGLTMNTILTNNNISQTTAGLIGSVALVASVPSNLILGFVGATFIAHQKSINAGVLAAGSIFMVIFVVDLNEWLPRSMIVIWVSVILGVMCITGVVPILFDMSTESAHPISEELSSTIMVLGNQIMCDIFTGVLQLHFDASNMNYVLIVSFILATVLACFYRTSNVRRLIDAHSITIEHLDSRSIAQIQNAGVRVAT